MASSAPTPLRQVLEERVKQLILDTESMFVDARDKVRREMADQMNQAVRRIRQTSNLEDLGATLVDATAAFCPSAALFSVSGDMLTGERIRGVSEAVAADFGALELALESAPAMTGAVESRDPVITATTPTEVSPEVAKLLEHSPSSRASIYPLVARDRVTALLYAWGLPQGPAIEVLAQVASLMWVTLTEPVPASEPEPAEAEPAPSELITISTLPPQLQTAEAPPAKPAASWEDLPPEEQRVHLQAQRFARVQVSEMRLFEPDAVQSGRARHNLYEALRNQIDAARETYRRSYFEPCASMVDYLHLELVRTLANDNPELLGGEYPGPMV